MKSKLQKTKEIEKGIDNLEKSETVIFTDFTGLTVNELNAFRRKLEGINAFFQVTKKRLLKIVFQKKSIEFEPKKFEGQVGVIFSPKDLPATSSLVYKFSKSGKAKKDYFKILGGFEVKEKKILTAAEVIKIGQLPSREALLGQLVGTLVAPIRSFVYVLSEKAKKVVQ